MKPTDQLIDQLVAQGPARPGRYALRFLAALALAWITSLAILWAVLGPPFPAISHAGTAAVIMKLAFAFGATLLASAAAYRLAIPGRSAASLVMLAALPFAAASFLTLLELGTRNAELGTTLLRCVFAIASLWPLCFAAALFSLKSLASTTPRIASAAASLTGAALAASAYGFWCPESSSTFLLLGYALPLAVLTLLGLVIGPRLLRW